MEVAIYYMFGAHMNVNQENTLEGETVSFLLVNHLPLSDNHHLVLRYCVHSLPFHSKDIQKVSFVDFNLQRENRVSLCLLNLLKQFAHRSGY